MVYLASSQSDMFAQRFVIDHENISLQLAAPLSTRDENHLTLPLLGVFVGQIFVLGTKVLEDFLTNMKGCYIP